MGSQPYEIFLRSCLRAFRAFSPLVALDSPFLPAIVVLGRKLHTAQPAATEPRPLGSGLRRSKILYQAPAPNIIDTIHKWGVNVVFGLPGDGINGIMEALRKRKDEIRFVQVRHEEAAAFMACGYAKYTGKLTALSDEVRGDDLRICCLTLLS
jgi:hypothetical protein